MNKVFGYQMLSMEESSHDISFFEAEPYLIDDKFGQIKIFVQPHSNLQGCFCENNHTYAYIWGMPVHPDVATADLPHWCIHTFTEKQYDRFKELIGTFVIIIDEPQKQRLSCVTDILGIRPMFYCLKNGRVTFGSDVWDLFKSGMTEGNIDYDAVSTWVTYGYNMTDGSLFSDLKRLPPGSVVTFQNDLSTVTPYAIFQSENKKIDIEQVSDEIHQIVSATTKTILAHHRNISISLSGGYDSRYLLGLASSSTDVSVDCATVDFNESEGIAARQVAETLENKLSNFKVNGSVWDFYDNPYHFMADGFPITKFVPYRIAQAYPHIPMLNGFMGDALIRGDSDRYQDKYETEWKEDLVDVLQQKHTKIRFELFQKSMAKRLKMRTRPPMERAVKEGNKLGKVFAWQDYYYTHRFFISNNFLQHLGFAEALIPFYNWSLLSYKMGHAYELFNWDTYRGILQKQFPQLFAIPHAYDLKSKNKKSVVSRCTRKWAGRLLPVMFDKKWLSLLQKKICIPLDCAGIVGFKRIEHTIFTLQRLYLFEKKMRDAGLDFDWECI